MEERTKVSFTNWKQSTERRDPVVNIPASYAGDPGFKTRPGDRLS
jgi:hypothetical protein